MYPGMRRIKNIHFVGVGGVGMAGIAEVLLNQGYNISGSDVAENNLTKRLEWLGANIYLGHQANNITGKDVVVVSSAIEETNVEVAYAKANHIPVVPRALMLGELMRFQYGIAVAGTHGKTTTTSLVSSIFAEAKLDPTFVIGGKLNSAGSNAKLGTGKYFIAEADESDASFLHLNPMVAIVTNIDLDHMETYQNDFEVLKQTFIDFIDNLPFYGLAVLCLDCPVIQSILPKITRAYVTYGFHVDADVRAIEYQQNGIQSRFQVIYKEEGTQKSLPIIMNLPGAHNVCNALAAIAVARQENIDPIFIASALEKFEGIGRRFQIYDDVMFAQKKITLVDDYGHHPAEIKCTIEAARKAWPDKRILMVFQPHRYSRTKLLFDDFVDVLSDVDALCLLDVFSAGESSIPNYDGRALSNAIRERKRVEPVFVSQIEKLASVLDDITCSDDIVLMLGAGSIGKMVQNFIQQKAA